MAVTVHALTADAIADRGPTRLVCMIRACDALPQALVAVDGAWYGDVTCADEQHAARLVATARRHDYIDPETIETKRAQGVIR